MLQTIADLWFITSLLLNQKALTVFPILLLASFLKNTIIIPLTIPSYSLLIKTSLNIKLFLNHRLHRLSTWVRVLPRKGFPHSGLQSPYIFAEGELFGVVGMGPERLLEGSVVVFGIWRKILGSEKVCWVGDSVDVKFEGGIVELVDFVPVEIHDFSELGELDATTDFVEVLVNILLHSLKLSLQTPEEYQFLFQFGKHLLAVLLLLSALSIVLLVHLSYNIFPFLLDLLFDVLELSLYSGLLEVERVYFAQQNSKSIVAGFKELLCLAHHSNSSIFILDQHNMFSLLTELKSAVFAIAGHLRLTLHPKPGWPLFMVDAFRREGSESSLDWLFWDGRLFLLVIKVSWPVGISRTVAGRAVSLFFWLGTAEAVTDVAERIPTTFGRGLRLQQFYTLHSNIQLIIQLNLRSLNVAVLFESVLIPDLAHLLSIIRSSTVSSIVSNNWLSR